MYDISNTTLDAVLNLFSRILPKGHCIPNIVEKVQRMVRNLRLNYVKIDVGEKDCVLFWKENANLDTFPKYGKSRWKMLDEGAHKRNADGGADTTNQKHVP